MVLGELGNFLFIGSLFWALCRWFGVIFGELGNFPSWEVDLEHCVGSFGWFWGS